MCQASHWLSLKNFFQSPLARPEKLLLLTGTVMLVASLSCSKAPTEKSEEITRSSDRLPSSTTASSPQSVSRRVSILAEPQPATPTPPIEPQEAASEPDPFLDKVHDLVDGAAAIYEKFEQTPGGMTPELALLTKSEWLDLARKNPDLSTPEAVQKALSQARALAKRQFLQQIIQAHRKFQNQNRGQEFVYLEQLAPYFSNPQTASYLARYSIPPKDQWPGFLEQFPVANSKGPVEFVLVEKNLPAGALEAPAVLFMRPGEIHFSPGNGFRSSILSKKTLP
jgi:hypothetical protein